MSGTTRKFTGVHDVVIPSGFIWKCRKPSLLTMISQGVFPSELTAMAMKLTEKKMDPEFDKKIESDPAALQQFAALVDALLAKTLVDPALTEEISDCTIDDENRMSGRINIADVDDFDKQYLFLWTQGLLKSPGALRGGSVDLNKFRGDQQRDTAGSGGEAVQPATIAVDRVAEATAGA